MHDVEGGVHRVRLNLPDTVGEDTGCVVGVRLALYAEEVDSALAEACGMRGTWHPQSVGAQILRALSSELKRAARAEETEGTP